MDNTTTVSIVLDGHDEVEFEVEYGHYYDDPDPSVGWHGGHSVWVEKINYEGKVPDTDEIIDCSERQAEVAPMIHAAFDRWEDRLIEKIIKDSEEF